MGLGEKFLFWPNVKSRIRSSCCANALRCSATATANSVFDTTFNADQVQAFGGATQWFQFVAFGLYGLSLLSVDDGKLPGWGKNAGYGFVVLVLGVQVASLFGLVPATLFVPVFVLGGVVLYPAFIISIGSTISKS